ncbi:MAG TPA: SDR family oxidoreductase [Acidimicrobiales bacterium]|jgi:ketoreductase RED2|nr:SDR family oxidoreductase [Acidimicrobiales bacterium]
MSADLKGKVALVTGSSSGIGAAVAATFADLGAGVVVNSSSSVVDGQQVAAGLPDAIYVQADVSDPDQAATLVASAVDHYGRLDIVVNNAGTTAVIPHHDLDAATNEIWERILRVNVLGTWNTILAAAPHLRASGDGIILNITSVAGLRPLGSSIPYAVSKAALNHLTVLLANVLGPEIRVHAVAPGLIDTPWTDGWDDVRAAVQERAPLRRSGTPDDVADACVALVGARYATGQVLVLDGGLALT